MAPLIKSRVPLLAAVASVAALAYGDVAAPLLLSPQTGWHFAAAVRWIWLAFAAAGAAKGLLLAQALLRLGSGPHAGLSAGGDGGIRSSSGSAEKGSGARKGSGTAGESGSKPEAAAKTAARAAFAAATQDTPRKEAAGAVPERPPPQGSFGPQDAQRVLLRVVALLTFVVASAAVAAPRVVRFIGGHLDTPLLKHLLGSAEAERLAQLLAAAALGPLFWALGALWAAGAAHTFLAGARPTRLRRLAAACPVVVLAGAAALEAAAAAGAQPLLPLLDIVEEAASLLPVPVRPVASVLTAVAAAFGAVAASAPLWMAASEPAPSLKEARTQRARAVGISGVFGAVRLLLVAWLAVLGHQLWALNAAARGTSPQFQTSDGTFKVLWREESAAGEFLSVIEGDVKSARFRLLRSGHSLLGGQYVEPAHYANQSVYDVFYMHEGVRLMTPGNVSLHVGLGTGVAARALAMHGGLTDVIENQPEIIDLAEKNFGWQPNGTVFAYDAELAVEDLLAEQPGPPQYDHIIHDVFSGGALPKRLMGANFLERLRLLLRPGGVIAVNFFGDPDAKPAQKLAADLKAVFGNVRAWGEHSRTSVRNVVFFASTEQLRVRPPTQADELQDGGRSKSLKRYFDRKTWDGDDTEEPDDGTRLNKRELILPWSPIGQTPLNDIPDAPTDLRERNVIPGGIPGAVGGSLADASVTEAQAAFKVAAEKAAAEAAEAIKNPAFSDGPTDAADTEAAAQHWRIMRRVFEAPLWAEAY